MIKIRCVAPVSDFKQLVQLQILAILTGSRVRRGGVQNDKFKRATQPQLFTNFPGHSSNSNFLSTSVFRNSAGTVPLILLRDRQSGPVHCERLCSGHPRPSVSSSDSRGLLYSELKPESHPKAHLQAVQQDRWLL
jgi:hypothetical protein